jgi:phosphohistidine phosphatase
MISDRTLILFRHAKSDWSGDALDIERSLAARGRRQAPEAGRWLSTGVGTINLAVVSPANRARTTWDLASAELDVSPETRIDDRLYGASCTDLIGVVHELSDDLHTVVLVGHNPGMEDLVSLLARKRVPMATSALALFDLSGSWSSVGAGSAALRAFGRPPAL